MNVVAAITNKDIGQAQTKENLFIFNFTVKVLKTLIKYEIMFCLKMPNFT